ncbi:hypothetical protein GDO81_023747 [Engystomops pustulosus]|uniref:Rab11-FIP3/4 domain-containing protein n=1 Tax=Engystomops pustulosus TaxID=76066 RepID=A0AAV6Z3N3_ENGPU|nr:hypothetical protein GDO81_023747 [Engystomops pustulosus]
MPPPSPSCSPSPCGSGCCVSRVHELEEMLRDQETRSEQILDQELKRHRETYSRLGAGEERRDGAAERQGPGAGGGERGSADHHHQAEVTQRED